MIKNICTVLIRSGFTTKFGGSNITSMIRVLSGSFMVWRKFAGIGWCSSKITYSGINLYFIWDYWSNCIEQLASNVA